MPLPTGFDNTAYGKQQGHLLHTGRPGNHPPPLLTITVHQMPASSGLRCRHTQVHTTSQRPPQGRAQREAHVALEFSGHLHL